MCELTPDVQAVFRRRRHQPRRPPHAVRSCRGRELRSNAAGRRRKLRSRPANIFIAARVRCASMQRPRRAAWQRNGWRTVKGPFACSASMNSVALKAPSGVLLHPQPKVPRGILEPRSAGARTHALGGVLFAARVTVLNRAAAESSPGTKNFFAKTSFTQRLPPLWAEPFLDRFLGEGA